MTAAPSVDTSLGLKLLPTVLSVIAGSADVISFLGLGGLFVAHITGNLVILAAHVVTGTRVGIAPMLSVPVFILVLGLLRFLAAGLAALGLASLRPLLVLQFVLLGGFLALSISAGPRIDPDGLNGVLAGMLGVSAMAVQNALVQLSVREAPSTAVMTTNITRFTMDVGEVLLGRDPGEVAAARRRANHTWPAIVGFAAGAGLGAALFMIAGPPSAALPTGLALLALTCVLRRPPALRRTSPLITSRRIKDCPSHRRTLPEQG
ncbi:MAG TPA: DUF1275 family protein [Pseudonocardia sp.]|uniref:YoaK family protein n=1 Tax=Pseudonocardia sp. TaxID=60912 RepID=UPI002C8664C2|nr:DUF1275 family protein [Pseudonocardia sp.]HTF46722.1 DUF1275 family protein [Pseudonocardia sp.]